MAVKKIVIMSYNWQLSRVFKGQAITGALMKERPLESSANIRTTVRSQLDEA